MPTVYTNLSGISNTDMKQAQKFITAIVKADLKGLRKVVKLKGFDPNILFRFESGMEKMSPLHYAAKKGQVNLVQELLELGCDANLTTPFDNATALFMACQNYNSELFHSVVHHLLTFGAEVNKGNIANKTPLIVASELGHLELVRLLLFHGADINLSCDEDEMPEGLRHSAHSGMLSEHELDELCDAYRGNNSLMQACRQHHVAVVEELLKRNCDVLAKNAAGNTALHLAAKSESISTSSFISPIGAHLAVMDALIKHRAPLNPRNKSLETPLKRAIDGIYEIAVWNIAIELKITETKTFFSAIELLIKAGCDVTLNYDGMTAIECLFRSKLISKYDSKALEELLEKCVYNLISAGCRATSDDILIAEEIMPACCKEAVIGCLSANTGVAQLKQLAKWKVRSTAVKPLEDSLPKLNLPKYLCNYVSLAIKD